MTEVKAKGYGEVKHTPSITNGDLKKLYSSLYMNPLTPTGLATKCQFDIRLYFLRRSKENMEEMTKSTFAIKKDSNGKKT